MHVYDNKKFGLFHITAIGWISLQYTNTQNNTQKKTKLKMKIYSTVRPI